MDISHLRMPHAADIINQVFHALHIVRHNCDPAVKQIINRYDGQVGPDQFQDLRGCKINVGDHHAVQAPVPAMFIITHSAVCYHIHRCKRDVIAPHLSRHLKAVQDCREIIVCQAALQVVREQNPQVIGPVCLQGTRGGIREISHLLCRRLDLLPLLLSDITVSIECLAHSCHGNIAPRGNIFHRYHIPIPPGENVPGLSFIFPCSPMEKQPECAIQHLL